MALTYSACANAKLVNISSLCISLAVVDPGFYISPKKRWEMVKNTASPKRPFFFSAILATPMNFEFSHFGGTFH